jgi:hypothetical protein
MPDPESPLACRVVLPRKAGGRAWLDTAAVVIGRGRRKIALKRLLEVDPLALDLARHLLNAKAKGRMAALAAAALAELGK